MYQIGNRPSFEGRLFYAFRHDIRLTAYDMFAGANTIYSFAVRYIPMVYDIRLTAYDMFAGANARI